MYLNLTQPLPKLTRHQQQHSILFLSSLAACFLHCSLVLSLSLFSFSLVRSVSLSHTILLSNNTVKMLSTNSDIQKKPVLIVQDGDKFHSRLLSKESSVANPSFRVYYGMASGSVPFLWESQPGTPKHVSTGTAVPPLTPPPSYYYTARSKSSKLKSSKSLNLIHTLLPKLSLRKNAHATSPPSPSSGSPSSASSVSSSSSFSSAASARRRCRRSSSTGLSFSSSRAEDEESDAGSPISTPLCFGGNLGRSYSVGLMKNFLLSVAGSHGSRHGAAAS